MSLEKIEAQIRNAERQAKLAAQRESMTGEKPSRKPLQTANMTRRALRKAHKENRL